LGSINLDTYKKRGKGMKQIIDGKLYDTDTATLLASNRYWDGHNFERQGRNTYLYKTSKGNFFLHNTTMWEGEHDTIEVIDESAAKEMYENLYEKEVEYQEAFGVEPEEG
jgi:hypothetical protein